MRIHFFAAPFWLLSFGSGFKVQGSGFKVQGSRFKVQGSRFKVQGSGFRVQGSGFRGQGSGGGFAAFFYWGDARKWHLSHQSLVAPTIRGKESSHMRGVRSFGSVCTCSGWGFSHIERFRPLRMTIREGGWFHRLAVSPPFFRRWYSRIAAFPSRGRCPAGADRALAV